MDDNLLHKLVDNRGRQFGNPHILPNDRCETVKIRFVLFVGVYPFPVCLDFLRQFFLFRSILSGQFQKLFVTDRTAYIVLIDTLENTIKFRDTLFGLCNFPPALPCFLFRFLKSLHTRHFHKRARIVKEHGGYIEYPAQHKPFQRFLADKVHGAIPRIALVPRAAVTVLLGGHILARSKMQFAAAVGAVKQAGEQPLPFRLFGGSAFVRP